MTEDLKTINVQLKNSNEAIALIGNADANLKVIEQELGVSIITRGETVYVSGDLEHVEIVGSILEALLYVIRKGINISQRDVMYAIQMAKKGTLEYFKDLFEEEIGKNSKGKSIRVKTIGQRHYISSMKKNDLVFGIGPAGTGKTYLAVVMAVNALKNGQVKRIILTRPAVEAGESLGFLPGDLKEKVDPYLRPLYDALHDMMPADQVIRRMANGEIEVAPLAFMRGRTLAHAYAILDEAQNTTAVQMKMWLTRMGEGTRMVVTGDLTQVDLPTGMRSGLRDALDTLEGVQGIGVVRLGTRDVVRHPLVARIVDAYDQRAAAEGDKRREARRRGAGEGTGK